MEGKNKNSIIIILVLILLIAIVAGGIVFYVINNSNDKDSKSSSESSESNEDEIEKLVESFAKAMKDEDKMDKFVDKYMDIKAVYAMYEVSEDYDIGSDDGDDVAKAFKKIYKNADEEDYEDYIDEMKDMMSYFVIDDDEDEKVKVKKIGSLKEYEDNTAFQKAKVTFEYDEEQEAIDLIFYNNKLVTIDYGYYDKYDSNEISTISTENELTKQEKDAYNSSFESYVGYSKSASDVKALIQSIINSNDVNIDQDGKFVTLEIDGELSGEKDFKDLEDACWYAYYYNDTYNVSSAANEMTSIKSKIDSSKKYDVDAEYEDGLITKITITEK